MKQIKNMEEIAGKTIDRTAYSDNNLFFFFTDGTFTIARGCGWEERDVEISDDEYDLEPNNHNLYELFEIGILNEKQYENLREEKEKRNQEKQTQNELAKLDELKRKYPDR